MDPLLRLSNLKKYYATQKAVDDIIIEKRLNNKTVTAVSLEF